MALSKEEKTLLLALNKPLKEKELSKEIDWKKLIALAKRFDVLSMVLPSLIQAPVPEKLLNELNEEELVFKARKRLAEKELKKTLKELSKKKIKAVLLKGAALWVLSPKHSKHRNQVDLDLLIEKEEMADAENVLALMGFKPFFKKNKSYSEKCFLHGNPMQKEFNELSVAVELHYNIVNPFDPFNVKETDLLNNTKKKGFFGENALVLENELNLIHLCLHLSYHHAFDFALKNLVDLNALVSENKINWNKAVKTSKDWDCSAFVFQSLKLAKKIFDTSIPKQVLKKLENYSNKKHLKKLEEFNEEKLFEKKEPRALFHMKFIKGRKKPFFAKFWLSRNL